MSKFETIEFVVGSHFVCALEYDDVSGLELSELRDLREFQERLPGVGHWSWGDEDEFARCEISDMMGRCTEATWVYQPSGE